MRLRYAAATLLVAALSRASAAAPPSNAIDEAHAAYERGAAAFDAHDYALAAREFARADALVPSSVALATAIKAAVLADLPALGMELVDRAESRAPDAALSAALDKARAKLQGRAGRLTISCPPTATCHATVDGGPYEVGKKQWVAIGSHDVVLAVDGQIAERRSIDVPAGGVVEVAPSPRAALAPTPTREAVPPLQDAQPSGLSPVWFVVAAGTTAALGGVTIASALDWQAKHNAFVERPTADLSAAGQAAQTRTNILFAVTGGALVATALLGIFGTRWRSAPRAMTHTSLTARLAPTAR